MKSKNLYPLFAAALAVSLTGSVFFSSASESSETEILSEAAADESKLLDGTAAADESELLDGTAASDESELLENEQLSFRPVDCGVQSEALYDFPFLGMTAKLSDEILKKMDSRDIFVYAQEDYTASGAISYAVLRFSVPTQEQQQEEGMSVDIFSWEAALAKLGAIGVYEKDVIAQLDKLTFCDTHTKLGESADGAYEYYISIDSKADAALVQELEKSEITITEMHAFDLNQGYTAFSADRIDGLETVGTFTMRDIFGEEYTQDMFADYDLTLVNVFATWCSPCVQEMPELEKLRQKYEDEGIKLGVAAIVLDVKTTKGIDEGALERAQTLYERSKAAFPFLIPDESGLNGRLVGIESIPESFFVDSDGNIVSEPYVGARSLEAWSEIADQELSALNK